MECASDADPGASANVVTGYFAAVRSALTADARPPLLFAGLRLHQHIVDIHASLRRNAEKKGARQR